MAKYAKKRALQTRQVQPEPKQHEPQPKTESRAAQKPKPAGKPTAAKASKWNFPFEKKNFIIAAVGLGVIILGYLLMATGISEQPAIKNGKWDNIFAVSIAPILLVIGYCVIIPYAIIKIFKKSSQNEEQ